MGGASVRGRAGAADAVFVAALNLHATADYTAFVAWMRSPATMMLMIPLAAMLFHHTALGLQVIVEDYVHSGHAPVYAPRAQNGLRFPFNMRILLAGRNPLFLHERACTPDRTRDKKWNRGAYLVEGLGHGGACHTPLNVFGAERGGNARYGGETLEGWHAPALNADSPVPVLWTTDAMINFLLDGSDGDHGIAAGTITPVVNGLGSISDDDAEAIATYIFSFQDKTGLAARTEAAKSVIRCKGRVRPISDGPVVARHFFRTWRRDSDCHFFTTLCSHFNDKRFLLGFGKAGELGEFFMKAPATFVTSGVPMLLAASGAMAAPRAPHDMAAVTPPITATWAGFYVGLTGGLSMLHSKADAGPFASSIGAGYGYAYSATKNGADALGGLFGGTVGFNFQSGKFVYGLEGDISWLGGSKASTIGAINTGYGYAYASTKTTSTVDALATLRARFGLDLNGTFAYVTGGLALGDVKDTFSMPGYGTVSHSGWKPGVVLGVGLEHKLSEHWSLKGEILWVGLQNDKVPTAAGYAPVKFSNDLAIFRLGVDYHF